MWFYFWYLHGSLKWHSWGWRVFSFMYDRCVLPYSHVLPLIIPHFFSVGNTRDAISSALYFLVSLLTKIDKDICTSCSYYKYEVTVCSTFSPKCLNLHLYYILDKQLTPLSIQFNILKSLWILNCLHSRLSWLCHHLCTVSLVMLDHIFFLLYLSIGISHVYCSLHLLFLIHFFNHVFHIYIGIIKGKVIPSLFMP